MEQSAIEFWINLRVNYDLLCNEPAADISEIEPIIAA